MKAYAYAVVACIVGLLAGALVAVFPLVYMMSYGRSLALVLQRQPEFDAARLNPAYSQSLASGVVAIGGVVMLLSAALMAIITLRQLRPGDEAAQEPSSRPEPEPGSPEF